MIDDSRARVRTLTSFLLCIIALGLLASCKKETGGSADPEKKPGAATPTAAKPDPFGAKWAFDASSPKMAAITFARALEADDAATARKVALGTDAEFELAKGFGQIMRSVRAYEAVAVKELGDDGKLSKDERITLVDLIAAFDSATEKVDGDKGTLAIPKIATMNFKKDGGTWKIVLDFLDNDAISEASAKALPAKARVVDTVKKEIEDGTHKRARVALEAVKSRLQEMDAENPSVKVRTDIRSLAAAIDLYKNNIEKYPTNLDALMKNPGNLEDWKGPYYRDNTALPLDPWGHPYQYAAPGKHLKDTFDLWSTGDGKHPPVGLDNWSEPQN